MSAFELPPEHLEMLVVAAQHLGITRLDRRNKPNFTFDLNQAEGRQKVFDLLQAHNSPEVASEVKRPNRGVTTTTTRLPHTWLSDPKHVVQVLQWVRSYEYQCSQTSSWNGSDAHIFCALITNRLHDQLAKLFDASWTTDQALTH